MKIRTDFVTNSSSSSYIICFARIADQEKAKKTIEDFDLYKHSKEDVEAEKGCFGYLGAEYCGAVIYDVDEVLKEHPDDQYVIIEESIDAYEDEDEVIYDYDFAVNKIIECITEENGFADIEVAEGEGRDG